MLEVDPRRSLAAGAMWLIVVLAFTFSGAAAVWVGKIARQNVLEQHVRRLSLETNQLSSDLGQELAFRLGAVRAARLLLRPAAATGDSDNLRELFSELSSAYPELHWIAVADRSGRIVSAPEPGMAGDSAESQAWFRGGLTGPWLGQAAAPMQMTAGTALGDMSAPIMDTDGRIVGVIASQLTWSREPKRPLRLTDESNPHGSAQAYVLDRHGVVLIGPGASRGKPWPGVETAPSPGERSDARFERLPDGSRVLVSRAPMNAGGVSPLGWQVQLCEPHERVYQRADAVALKILWVSLGLGAATACLGIAGALQLTRRLKRLTQSVAALGRDRAARIELPAGQDEVAQLAAAFSTVHRDLRQERAELTLLSSELERRVAIRTQEVERLAEESRYAAIVRERLTIARDLHDTLAHSMMAMLSEIRLLRRLLSRDPGAMAAELERAEQVAHEGLKEARAAITQMRANAVRETGLGPALASLLNRFIDHTGINGELDADAQASRFGDERAETLVRMTQEVLRNIERHAKATRVTVVLKSRDVGRLELRIEDNGIGFDPHACGPGHYGLIGLREQAQLIGAHLEIHSKPNEGTMVSVSLPLSPIAFANP